jgi:hypothetical protein
MGDTRGRFLADIGEDVKNLLDERVDDGLFPTRTAALRYYVRRGMACEALGHPFGTHPDAPARERKP